MDFLGMAYPGVLPTDALVDLIFGFLKILAYGAVVAVLAGVVTTCLCDLFECRKWRRCHGRTETWQLMH